MATMHPLITGTLCWVCDQQRKHFPCTKHTHIHLPLPPTVLVTGDFWMLQLLVQLISCNAWRDTLPGPDLTTCGTDIILSDKIIRTVPLRTSSIQSLKDVTRNWMMLDFCWPSGFCPVLGSLKKFMPQGDKTLSSSCFCPYSTATLQQQVPDFPPDETVARASHPHVFKRR